MYGKYDDLLRVEDLVNNPCARVPVCLCLDTSGSMFGPPINELNEGVKLFFDAIREDETALYSAEISIVTFGEEVKSIVDFSTLDRIGSIPTINADGETPLGEAVNLALDMLEARKEQYKSKGVDYFQPWLVLMTDGMPNGNPNELYRAIQRTNTMVNERKLSVFPIGIGQYADMQVLSQFSPKRVPLRLKGLRFREFFAWLSQSVSRTSQSLPGESIPLDVEGLKAWTEVLS